jgi:hypothetical protein
MCGQNAEGLKVKSGGIYSYRRASEHFGVSGFRQNVPVSLRFVRSSDQLSVLPRDVMGAEQCDALFDRSILHRRTNS